MNHKNIDIISVMDMFNVFNEDEEPKQLELDGFGIDVMEVVFPLLLACVYSVLVNLM